MFYAATESAIAQIANENKKNSKKLRDRDKDEANIGTK